MLGHNSDLDAALLNVKNRICDLTLLKHFLVRVEVEGRFPFSHLGEKYFRIKRGLNCVAHVNLRHPIKDTYAVNSKSRMRLDAVTGQRSSSASDGLLCFAGASISTERSLLDPNKTMGFGHASEWAN